MRDDSLLYGGTRANPAEKRQRISHEKEVKRDKLLPVAEIVLGALDKERKSTELQLLKMINPTTPKEIESGLLSALNLYDQSMAKLTNQFKNILRKAEKEVEEDD